MKIRLLLGVLAVLLWGRGAVQAQTTATVTVDENGHGSFVLSGVGAPLGSFQTQDPVPGGLANALFYAVASPLLIPFVTPGDLTLNEPGGGQSDLIRFEANDLVFYSDNTDGGGDLADIGFPTAMQPITLTLTETGPEGNNGLTYTPTSGQPGFFVGTNLSATYVIISDGTAVPEPSGLVLLGLGGIGLIGYGWRRQQA